MKRNFWLLIILCFCQFTMADNQLLPVVQNKNSLSGLLSTTESNKFLPVDQAFQLDTWRTETGGIRLVWQIAEGYYLYQHRTALTNSTTNADISLTFPPGEQKTDEYFGEVEVYYQQLNLEIPADLFNNKASQQFKLRYQGCADAGLCYPPQTRFLEIGENGTVLLSTTAPTTALGNKAVQQKDTGRSNVSPESGFTAILASAQLISITGLFFAAGLALTFTPCVLPMVPIISGIVLGQQQTPSRGKAFTLSLTYVLAMAFTYALAGTLTGYFGAGMNLQMKLQSPAVLIVIASLFALLSLAMFGLYELRLPDAIQNRLHQLSSKQSGGHYAGVAFMGILSSLIVSPCVSAPLAGALIYIGSTGDPLLGGLALLALGMGMGLPLLLIGTFGTQLLPKSGAWTNQVKNFFGVLMLGLAIWMLDRIIPDAATITLFALLLTGYGGFLLRTAINRTQQRSIATNFFGCTITLYGLLLLAGAVNGGTYLLNPMANFNQQRAVNIMQHFNEVTDFDTLQQTLAVARQNGKPVMLDIYADWCISCIVLEREVFTEPNVAKVMAGFTLLRIDITDNAPAHQTLLEHYGLFGPPALLFFNVEELRQYRIQGEISAAAFKQHLDAVILATQRDA